MLHRLNLFLRECRDRRWRLSYPCDRANIDDFETVVETVDHYYRPLGSSERLIVSAISPRSSRICTPVGYALSCAISDAHSLAIRHLEDRHRGVVELVPILAAVARLLGGSCRSSSTRVEGGGQPAYRFQ